MNKPLISVIVPVYNVEKYLAKCLESIIDQTYTNLEIICINDGATDNSLQILNEYSRKDKRIKVINNENKGVGASRNIGLELAMGDYVSFIDSDDWVDNTLYEKCINVLGEKTEVVIFGAKIFNIKNGKIYKGQYSSKKFKNNFDIKKLFKYYPVAWNKLYKRKFLIRNNITFPNYKTAEDQLFFVKAILQAKNIKILKEDLYFYTKYRNNTLSNRIDEKDFSNIQNCLDILKFLNLIEVDEKLKNQILTRYLLKVLSWYGKLGTLKTDETFEYLISFFEQFKRKTTKNWWDYYKLNKNSSYLDSKFEFIKSNIVYFIREKLIVIPALFCFAVYFIAELLKKDKHE